MFGAQLSGYSLAFNGCTAMSIYIDDVAGALDVLGLGPITADFTTATSHQHGHSRVTEPNGTDLQQHHLDERSPPMGSLNRMRTDALTQATCCRTNARVASVQDRTRRRSPRYPASRPR